jgi:hypothetical protein
MKHGDKTKFDHAKQPKGIALFQGNVTEVDSYFFFNSLLPMPKILI